MIDAPPTLKSSNHWVLREGKRPVNKDGKSKGWADPSFWMAFDEALEALQCSPDKFSGLGYIVDRDTARGDNQIIGGDLDNCRDPITGWVSSWAQSFLSTVNACTSISISGCGFRFFCIGKLPDELNNVIRHGPDDLTEEAKIHIIDKKPNIEDKLALDEPTWNGFEIYESGPRHLTITGDWLPGYPEDLQNRTSEIRELIEPFLNKQEAQKESPEELSKDKISSTSSKSTSSEAQGSKLPFLSILQVIDTSNFSEEGDELVGSHPLLGSSTGSNLKVNLAKNAWYYFHAGNETGGDSWLWLACECGAIAWEDCGTGALKDASVLEEVKRYAVKKGYFKEEELFPRNSSLKSALDLISELKEKVLQDPGLPFEQKYIKALATLKIYDQPEFERIKAYLKGKVSWRDLSNRVNEASIKITKADGFSEEPSSEYITWIKDRPILSVGSLLEDILTDLNACVIAGTEKDLAIYNTKTGTYDIGKSAMRLILSEAIRRIKIDGDLELECLTPSGISKIRSLAPALALEIGDAFEKMVSCICVGNGVVDLRASKLIEWSPDWLMIH